MISKQSTYILATVAVSALFTGQAYARDGGLSAASIALTRISNTPLVAASATNDASALQKQSEQLINSLGDQAISFMSNTAMTDQDRQEAFRKLLSKNFDMKTIGRFVLGRYWRSATPEQLSEYQGLFEKMVVSVYSERFKEYSGQKFYVKGSRLDTDKDTLVASAILPKDGGQEIPVEWRVRQKSDGRFQVVDVIVAGISMSVTQRSDFSAVIQRGGGNLDVLLAHLRKG